MSHVVIINLSPRENKTSNMLASMCSDYLLLHGKKVKLFHLYKAMKQIDSLLMGIEEAATIVFCGPCYINHFPADTIYLLEQINENKTILHNQNMYGVIQGGMPYVHTHESGVKTLELFCEDLKISYKGSFVVGLGAMLNGQKLDKLINGKKVKKNYITFLQHILNGEYSPDKLYQESQIKLPQNIYWLLSKGMNKTINKELEEKGIDYLLPSPYWDR
jgi:hypothetical protein